MKPIWMSFTVFLLALSNLSFKGPAENITSFPISDDSSFSDSEVRQRLNEISGKVDLKYNSAVEKKIRHYLSRSKKSLSDIIGRSQLFFPIFEHFLQVNEMPDELKFLSIVESSLKPGVKSPAGASGLWQFMKRTGYQYGLKVDSYIDERNDPIKATKAAFEYLYDLEKRYGDWTLAIAAYNCGPGRMNRAIRSAQSTDYWKLSKFLPVETRNYVPKFIAVTYLMNFYENHGIKPGTTEFDFQKVRTITLFEAKSFTEISKMSGVNSKTIETLNPAYKRKYIPKSEYGNYLTLPVEGMSNLKDTIHKSLLKKFYKSKISNFNEFMNFPKNMIQSTYRVQKGESIAYIARLLNCTEDDLVSWNKLKSPFIFNGQELTIFLPNEQLIAGNPNLEKVEEEENPVQKIIESQTEVGER